MEPVVAVIIPAYRAWKTLGETVQSLLNQTLACWQAVIVADDGEDYRSGLAALGRLDPRLSFASTGRVGAGPSVARNVGLAAVRAPLVAPLDADDRFAPERLARLVPMALAHGAAVDNVAVVSDADDRLMGILFPEDGSAGDRLSASDFLATSVPMFPVCRRDAALRWDEDARFAEDVIFNVHLLERLGAIPLCPDPLYQYRVRSGSLSTSVNSAAVAECAYVVMLARLERDGLGLTRTDSREALRVALEHKRAVNRAFARSGFATFQAFLADGQGELVRPASDHNETGGVSLSWTADITPTRRR